MEQTRPLADWNNERSEHPNLIWWTRLDGRFQIEVRRTGGYRGVLCIFDRIHDNALIFQEEVGLAYCALFGPDVADVEDWKIRSLEFVDSFIGGAS